MFVDVFRGWVDQGNNLDNLLKTEFPPNSSYLYTNFTSFIAQVSGSLITLKFFIELIVQNTAVG